jgi:hypothetical protein
MQYMLILELKKQIGFYAIVLLRILYQKIYLFVYLHWADSTHCSPFLSQCISHFRGIKVIGALQGGRESFFHWITFTPM